MTFLTQIPLSDVQSPAGIARAIDHTLLKPEGTPDEIRKLCHEAREWNFCTVCVNPLYIGLAAKELQGSPVLPICVVGFPLGASTTAAKAFETRQAIADGAQEIDMVIAVGELKSGNLTHVREDIRGVVEAAQGKPVKVIIETALLTDDEKKTACRLSAEAGAHYVKTSTGFSKGGATVEDIRLMRAVVGDKLGVKASGGVRTLEQALAMIEAGASRVGASASVQIVEEARKKFG